MAGGTGAGPQISVDMSGLTRLANDLSRYADQAIQGEADNARGALGTGVPFGSASASGYVYSAKHRYHQNLRRVIDTLREFAAEGRALSAGAGSAATNYRAADTSAAARTASAGSPLAGT
ncbi:MAG TPA: hypothetical protein VES42_11410, partial [Pilimelia sp.]|nr:hypothetical protein [Pilimelia sp.]